MKQNILLALALAVALYLAADGLIANNLACWIEPPTGQSACTWDDVEFIRWPTTAAELAKYGLGE
jgi:hypothetical protein